MYTDNYNTADYIIAVGDRKETFDFILKRFRQNIPIIHLWSGEISQGTHDEIYRHSITLMSMMQLCTHQKAKWRTDNLCNSIDKKPNSYIIGNLFLDNIEINENTKPDYEYNLILYNPPTNMTDNEIEKETHQIYQKYDNLPYIWIEPNGDKGSNIVNKYTNTKNLPRNIFLGLLKNCNLFITNSSSQYYEAPLFLKPDQIISIGDRNKERECKHSDLNIKHASDNIIKTLEIL